MSSERDQWLKWLRREVGNGLNDLNEGNSIRFDWALASSIKKEGREILKRRSSSQNG